MNDIAFLRDNLKNDFGDCMQIRELLISFVISFFKDDFTTEDDSTDQCINTTVVDKVDMDALTEVASELLEIYATIVPSIEKISLFLASQENRSQNATVSSECVAGFIEAAFCRQCRERTPPLCLATCSALVRGCYSPYYTVYNNRQFSALWIEVQRVVGRAVTTVQSGLSSALEVVNSQSVVSYLYIYREFIVVSKCPLP